MTNSFNLIDEPWIPVAEVGRVSLEQVFSNPEYRTLGGNPVQKIAMLKLLLAICQSAVPLADEKDWQALDESRLAGRCQVYLEQWHDRFFLYGNEPFLQVPALEQAEQKSYGALLPEVATGNTTVLTQFQHEKELDDGEKALLLVCLMGFALGGKKADNSAVLSPGYKGKSKAAKPGPSLASRGLLHSFVMGSTILQTLRINLLTQADMQHSSMFPRGIGTAPWEKMVTGEDCPVARDLKRSLMGRLVPLSRFCLLRPTGMHYSEGLAHLNYQEGMYDPTVAADTSSRKTTVLWTDPEKRPWRELPALLSFITQGRGAFDCLQLRLTLPRAARRQDIFAVWSGGLRVSFNAGEQYVSGADDFVESEVWLRRQYLGEPWFNQLQVEMKTLEDISKNVRSGIRAYYREQKAEGDKLAGLGVSMYWQLCERNFQALVDSCEPGGNSEEKRYELRRSFAAVALSAFDHFCPNDTARQMDAWARHRPNLAPYLNKEVT